MNYRLLLCAGMLPLAAVHEKDLVTLFLDELYQEYISFETECEGTKPPFGAFVGKIPGVEVTLLESQSHGSAWQLTVSTADGCQSDLKEKLIEIAQERSPLRHSGESITWSYQRLLQRACCCLPAKRPAAVHYHVIDEHTTLSDSRRVGSDLVHTFKIFAAQKLLENYQDHDHDFIVVVDE